MYESVFAGAGQSPSAQPMSGTDAAFGPPPEAGTGAGIGSIFHPQTGFGLAFWFGVGGVAALILIYRSLPG